MIVISLTRWYSSLIYIIVLDIAHCTLISHRYRLLWWHHVLLHGQHVMMVNLPTYLQLTLQPLQQTLQHTVNISERSKDEGVLPEASDQVITNLSSVEGDSCSCCCCCWLLDSLSPSSSFRSTYNCLFDQPQASINDLVKRRRRSGLQAHTFRSWSAAKRPSLHRMSASFDSTFIDDKRTRNDHQQDSPCGPSKDVKRTRQLRAILRSIFSFIRQLLYHQAELAGILGGVYRRRNRLRSPSLTHNVMADVFVCNIWLF